MSFEAESFRFPVQNKIHKPKMLSDIRTGILGSIVGPCDFLPARSDEFQKVCCTISLRNYISNFYNKAMTRNIYSKNNIYNTIFRVKRLNNRTHINDLLHEAMHPGRWLLHGSLIVIKLQPIFKVQHLLSACIIS